MNITNQVNVYMLCYVHYYFIDISCLCNRIAYLAKNYIHYDETVLIYWENTENYYLTWKQTNEL